MGYTVYMHTSPSGKVYVGITKQKPEKRWNYGYGYVRNDYFINAIKKYKWENFKHEILFEGLTKEEAEQKEVELITLYKSNQKEYGYNIDNGGNCFGTHSEETLKKMSESNKGKNKGKTGYWKSHEMPNNLKEMLRERGKKSGKAVIQIDNNGNVINEFKSISEAARNNEVSKEAIWACCKGKIFNVKNSSFLYKEDWQEKIAQRLVDMENHNIKKTFFPKGHIPWNKRTDV